MSVSSYSFDTQRQNTRTGTEKNRIELLVSGYVKSCHLIIPNDIIELCFIFYYATLVHLQFSDEWRSNEDDRGLELSDNNKCVQRMSVRLHQNHRSYTFFRWIMVDTDNPIYAGIHCWRIKVENPSKGWYSIGLGPLKRYKNKGTAKMKHVCGFGMNKIATIYPRKHDAHDLRSGSEFNHCECEIDMLFDANKGELSFALVQDQLIQFKIWAIPIDAYCVNGWCPHFNLGATSLKLRIAKIPRLWYAKKKDELFQCDDSDNDSQLSQ
eukprot:882490_1